MDQIQGQTMIDGVTPSENQQLNFFDAINFALPQIEVTTEKLKSAREHLESELLQSTEYSMRAREAQEAIEKRKKAKESAMARPICREYIQDIKDLRADLKTQKSVLSQVVVKYTEQTGQESVKGPDGNDYQIVKSAKLVKARGRRK